MGVYLHHRRVLRMNRKLPMPKLLPRTNSIVTSLSLPKWSRALNRLGEIDTTVWTACREFWTAWRTLHGFLLGMMCLGRCLPSQSQLTRSWKPEGQPWKLLSQRVSANNNLHPPPPCSLCRSFVTEEKQSQPEVLVAEPSLPQLVRLSPPPSPRPLPHPTVLPPLSDSQVVAETNSASDVPSWWTGSVSSSVAQPEPDTSAQRKGHAFIFDEGPRTFKMQASKLGLWC